VNSTVLRWVATVAVSSGLALGLGATAAGAVTDSRAARTPTAGSAVCTQLRKRLAGASATLKRVDANLQELRTLLTEVRLPARRAVLHARIQRLEQLRTALATRIADARDACGAAGSTT
jgi:hypothetical protein